MTYPPEGYIVLKYKGKHYPMQLFMYPDGSFTLHTLADSKGENVTYSKRGYAVAYCYTHRERSRIDTLV